MIIWEGYGNLFHSEATVLTCTVNTVGAMGAGIALKFKHKYPDVYQAYTVACKAGKIKVGEPVITRALAGQAILLFPTKKEWWFPSKLAWIEEGLRCLVKEPILHDPRTRLAMVPLGCSNGKLDYNRQVKPLLYQYLDPLPCRVKIFL